MKVFIQGTLALLFFLFLWQVGKWADSLTQSGQLTAGAAAAFSLLLFLAVVSFIFGMLPAIALYSPQDMSLGNFRFPKGMAKWNPAKRHVVLYVAASYGTAIYLFAVIFKVISNFEENAFKPAIDGLGAASYFSVATIATVGYGDIVPVTAWARFAASAEILAGMVYVVFFLSIVAGFLREEFQSQSERRQGR